MPKIGSVPIAGAVAANQNVVLRQGGNDAVVSDFGADSLSAALEALSVRAAPYLFNNNTLDVQRANFGENLIASAAYTATQNTADQTNHNARGVLVQLDVTIDPASASIVLVIQALASTAAAYEDILRAAAVDAVGRHSFLVYPGVGVASGDITQVAGFVVPRTWRVRIEHADADSLTYSLDAYLLN